MRVGGYGEREERESSRTAMSAVPEVQLVGKGSLEGKPLLISNKVL